MISPSCLHCRQTKPADRELEFAGLLRDLTQSGASPVYLCGEAERALRRWCRETARASATTIQRLHDAGHFKHARRARKDHLAKATVQLDALFTAARKRWPTGQDMPDHKREMVRRTRVQSIFEKLPQVERLTRPARAQQFLIDKDNGRGKRPVTSFHWVDRARQIVLRSALTPFANLHQSQFMLARDRSRRGPAAVREVLLTALAEHGADYQFLHFDVENFFGSISHNWLERHLGLDPAVTKHQVHLGSMMIVPTGEMATVHATHEAIREGGQWGIPQGSALSCLIAEQVMADILRSAAVFEEWPVFVWSDNVGMLVPRHRAGEIANLVRDAFAAHGAGPFNLRDAICRDVTQEFEFLGVNYRLADGVIPRAFIAREKVEAWRILMGHRIMLASTNELDEIAAHIRQKGQSWSWWSGWDRVDRSLRSMIDAARASQSGHNQPAPARSGSRATAGDGVL